MRPSLLRGNAIALALLALAILFAFGLGRFPVGPGDLARILWSGLSGQPSGLPAQVETVIWNIRGPRVVAALLCGAALAVAGTAFQGLFRNPLVSPDILGASSGAALGAVLGIYLSLGLFAIQLAAFIGGLVAVGAVYAVGSTIRRGDPVLVLVLTGVVVGSLLGAGIGLIKYWADPYNQLPAMTFWLLGSLAGTDRSDLIPLLGPVLAGSAVLVALRWRMNAMSLPEEEARALGLRTGPLRLTIVVAATLVTAASVAAAGIIGWVGLVVPHLARFLVGPDFAKLVPTAAILGGGYLLVIDTLARTAGPVETPLGILTAVIGTPFFIWLLASARGVVVTLAASELVYGYRERIIGCDIALSLERGEVLALLGPNGSGKTTLLKTLLGLLPPRSGSLMLDGVPLAGISPAQRARALGYVPQAHAGTFAFTVRAVVLMGRSAHGGLFSAPSARDHAVVDAMLERLGIGRLAEQPYTLISGGERQLVLIARALAQEPAYVILDEPTASLDFGNQGRVMREIRRLAAEGLGVLFTTHDPNQALRHADRVMMIREGQAIASGRAEDLLTPERLEGLYGVGIETLRDGDGRVAFLPG